VPAQRLQHASVEVPPNMVEECARFYTGVLGMRRIENLAGSAWFSFGDGDHVHLLEGAGGGASRSHMALLVDDLEATLERARAAGADVRQSDDLWGSQRWFLRDPAGNRIEIFDRAPED
jgi:catechol 2,3-dioxygenase-like lactoylglutathione lyase family enzyme